jgi:hypothetical protein
MRVVFPLKAIGIYTTEFHTKNSRASTPPAPELRAPSRAALETAFVRVLTAIHWLGAVAFSRAAGEGGREAGWTASSAFHPTARPPPPTLRAPPTLRERAFVLRLGDIAARQTQGI